MVILRRVFVIICQMRKEALLVLLKLILIAIECLMPLLEVIQLLPLHRLVMVPNLPLEVHLTFVEGLQVLLLLLVSLEGCLVFDSLLLGVIEGQHIPHGDLGLLFGAAHCLTQDGLVDVVLGFVESICAQAMEVISSPHCRVIVIFTQSHGIIKRPMD